MNSAREINKKLDEILSLRGEMAEMDRDVADNAILKNKQTGDDLTKEDALKCIEGVIDRLKEDLDKLTNGGKNCREMFTNPYYVNDMSQDKIANQKLPNKIKENFTQEKYNKLHGIKKMPNIDDEMEI
jgi:hypothetical protein|tara:strand:+ start:1450 stop:1833 length:384 start_codon:yes stop_codon:yes gene_type:complete